MSGELERLKERVRRDPNSRSFIPLADLYRKEGMVEEAVHVLTEGLERQPDYMSARVALGKIYLEENKLENALTEFNLVVKAIPGNLFAQRKLADIYMMMEDAEKAREAYETVVRLNPLDTEAEAALKKLKAAALPESPHEGDLHEMKVDTKTETPENKPFALSEEVSRQYIQGQGPQEPANEDVFHGETAEGPFSEGAGMKNGSQEVEELPAEEGLESQHDISNWFNESAPSGPADVFKGEEILHEENIGACPPFDRVLESVLDEAGCGQPEAVLDEAEGVRPEASGLIEGPSSKEEAYGEAEKSVLEEDDGVGDLKRADDLVRNGEYARGFMVLRRRLELFPADLPAMQKLEELKVLIRLLGLENEIRASMLESFLQSAQKRKNGPPENS